MKIEPKLTQRERGYTLRGHSCFNCRFVRLTPGERYLDDPKCSCSYDGKRVLAMACCDEWEPKKRRKR